MSMPQHQEIATATLNSDVPVNRLPSTKIVDAMIELDSTRRTNRVVSYLAGVVGIAGGIFTAFQVVRHEGIGPDTSDKVFTTCAGIFTGLEAVASIGSHKASRQAATELQDHRNELARRDELAGFLQE